MVCVLPCLCIRSRTRFGASDSLPSWFRLWFVSEDRGGGGEGGEGGWEGEGIVCAW